MKVFRIDPFQLDDLRRACEAADDSHRRGGNIRKFSEEPDDCLVRFAIHRRRGDMQLPGVSVWAGEFRPVGAGADLKRESGFHY